MAQVVLGLGTSHTPMLLVDGADLPRYEENDRRLSLLDLRWAAGQFRCPAGGAAGRRRQSRQNICQPGMRRRMRAMAGLADALASAALDALIVIGDDQKEMLRGEQLSAAADL